MRTSNDIGLKDYAETFNCKFYPGQKPWRIKADLAIPSATQNEINEEDAKLLIDNDVKYIIEASNMPISSEALALLIKNDICIGPGKAANAGGVAVSGLEMTQNSERLSWTTEEVDNKLKEIMDNIYHQCVSTAEAYGYGYDLIAGANIAGFLKVANAMIEQGDY
jgi:glutamate dehydrogenase (NADP+)